MSEQYQHIPVMLDEVIESLQPRANDNFIDATVGLGGHTKAILDRTGPKGKVMVFDRDQNAIDKSQENLAIYGERVIYINQPYTKIKIKIDEYKFYNFNGIVCDLGYSSAQVEDYRRGFSFNSDEALDLRYDQTSGITADEILNTFSEDKLVDILRDYGEEKFSKTISRKICQFRSKTKITGMVLREIAERVYGRNYRKPSRIHPATKIWQALRIAVNDEMNQLESFLEQAIEVMPTKARLAVISFHSIEDRLVKNYFRQEAKDCLCPKEAPKCICGHQQKIKIVNKKPIIPSEQEIVNNPRSRSAKLRIIEKK